MSFIDNIKSRITRTDNAQQEEAFQRGLREGSWPEGVEDFQLMENTGAFLPAQPPQDPYAQGNVPAYGVPGDREMGMGEEAPYDENWSVVRAAGSNRTENRLRVIEGTGSRQAPVAPDQQAPAQRGFEDEGVQVIDREETRVPRSKPAPAPQKSYAERLRERVGSAGPAIEEEIPAPAPVLNRPSVSASSSELDDEFASRRARREMGAGPRPAQSEPPAQPARTRDVVQLPTFTADALIVRARSYDDVRSVASGLLTDHRPVAISMRGCPDNIAQRILDFSFGLCCATGAIMEELGPKVYAVVPKGTSVSEATLSDLRRQGLLK